MRDLTVIYAAKRANVLAVDRVDFDIPEGEIFCLVGPSGCGKSTILNVVAGFVQPTTGRVEVHGQPVSGPGADRAVVHQQTTALLPWYSVERNVGLGLRAKKGLSRRERTKIVASYLDLVGLSDFAHAAIYELSGGMQQRVALARALATESPIVLLDEPLGAVDALQREIMQDFLLRIWGETRRTFLLITHSAEEAVYLGSEVLVMSARPGRITTRHRHSFNQQALGRTGSAVKTSPEFVRAVATLLGELKATGPGEAARSEDKEEEED